MEVKIQLILTAFIFSTQVIVNARTTTKRPLLPFKLPENRSFKIALGYHEDTYLNFTEITTKYGYPTEEHTTVTDDGYILKIFRLVRGKRCNGTTKKTPVLLMHGLFASADMWLIPKPSKALGYLLADACYDVWAANQRGSVYSRSHVALNPDTDTAFWDFSFDEHGLYDVPAVIDYILKWTQRPKLFYIGHSQGTTNFYAMASMKPEYNDKVQLAIHLAPVAWFKHTKSPLLRLIAGISNAIRDILDTTGYREVLSRMQITYNLGGLICHLVPSFVCSKALSVFTGTRYGSIPDKTIALVIGHVSGQSSRSLSHFAQLVNSGNFRRYDEGSRANLKKYGSALPPKYPVSKITAPVVLVCGTNDMLSSLQDVDILASNLPNVVEYYVVPESSWSHNNHVFDKTAPRFVFSKILSYFDARTSE